MRKIIAFVEVNLRMEKIQNTKISSLVYGRYNTLYGLRDEQHG